MRVTISNPRSFDTENFLLDEFKITFKDNCADDRLTGPTADLEEIEYVIGSGASSTIEVSYTQGIDGCPISSKLEFFSASTSEFVEYATEDFVESWNG